MGEYEEILKKTLQLAESEGINEIITQMNEGKTYQVHFSNSAIDNVKTWDEEVLELFLVKDKRTTQINVEAPDIDKIKETLSQVSKFLEKMPKSNLYNGMETEQHSYHSIEGLYDGRIKDFPDKAPNLVNAAIQSSLEVGAKKVAGVLYFGYSKIELMTSHDVTGSFDTSYYKFNIRSFVDDQSSGQGIACGKNLTNIEKNFVQAGEEAGNIAKMARGGTQGKAGKYDLIMNPIVVANVFGQVTTGAHPLLMMIGMSPLSMDHLGKKIASEQLTITDDALLGEGLGSRPFDIEGTPAGKTPIFTEGVLAGILHNTSTSKMNNAKNTGNSTFFDFGLGSKMLAPGPSNTVYKPGGSSLEEIIADSRKPTIYITSNWYTRFTNMMEGTFSTIPRDGMFLIDKGEIKKPVRKLRLSDNVLGMLSRIATIGNDIKQITWWEVPTPTFVPTIKVADCNITTATQ